MENARPMQFKSYQSGTASDLLETARIWQVARATSAAPSFFDPVQIGHFGEGFSDGGTGTNNPVQKIWTEARHTFLRENQLLEGNLKCLVSIGTGKPALKPFGKKLQTVGHTLIRIATDTERTAEAFRNAHWELEEGRQYFRFNVEQGLENIGLEDAAQANTIMAATRHYLDSSGLQRQMQECGRRLVSGSRRRRIQNAPRAPTPTPTPPKKSSRLGCPIS